MNTTKHVFTGGGNGKLTQYMIDMAKAAVGEENFEERCPVTFNTCPISPLKLTADVCEVIMTAARNGATVNVLSMGMAGGSTPVNLAGALVVHNSPGLSLRKPLGGAPSSSMEAPQRQWICATARL